MDFILINQFYPPARAPTGILLRDVAIQLRDRGHRVVIIASAALYGGEDAETGRDEGIDVRRVGPVRRHGTGWSAKGWDYVRFFISAYRLLHSFRNRLDGVLCMTTPPFCGLMAQRCKRRHGIPYALWCMDLYPEALRAGGMLRTANPLYRLLYRLAQSEREAAGGVLALGSDMTRLIGDASPSARITEIPVWSSLQVTSQDCSRAEALRQERGWKPDEVILMYSGNIGRAHRIDEVGELAQLCAAFGCRAVIYGAGPLRAAWQQRWGSVCDFHEPVPRRDLVPHLLSADVHVITQEMGWSGVVVPSKYQAACALGRPVLFVGPKDSAVANWIEVGDTGWTIDPACSANTDAIMAEMQRFDLRARKGEAASLQSSALFDPTVNAMAVADQLERIAGKGTA